MLKKILSEDPAYCVDRKRGIRVEHYECTKLSLPKNHLKETNHRDRMPIVIRLIRLSSSISLVGDNADAGRIRITYLIL